jgi:hypothetical protein
LKTFIVSLFILLFSLSSLVAEPKSTVSAADMELILLAAGFEPEMHVDENSGDPYATLKEQGFGFFIRGKNCNTDGCSVLMFVSNFDLDRAPTDADFRAVNAYNDAKLRGRAYVNISDEQVGIDLVLDLTGGAEVDTLRLHAGRFPDMIQAFVDTYREAME